MAGGRFKRGRAWLGELLLQAKLRLKMIPSSVFAFAFAALLAIGFQNCGSFQPETAQQTDLASMATTVSCTPGGNLGCKASNGSGNQTCNSSGNGYGACVLSSCNPGYTLQGGVCIANSCAPGSTISCTGANGTGSQTCNTQGTGFGTCQLNACSAGYNLSNQTCNPDYCLPSNQTQSCSTSLGVGLQTCNGTGSGWNACVLNSCIAGYYLQSGVCIPDSCTPGSTTSCTYGNGTGLQTCNAQGSGFGSCAVNACNSGYNLQSGLCVANTCNPNVDTQACTASDGSGTGLATCNATGTGWGACVLNACTSGYNLQGTSCVADSCTPGAITSCTSGNGSGNQTCNTTGTANSTCTLTSCNSGYTLQNGVCVTDVCTPDSTVACYAANGGVGTQTCNNPVAGYDACVVASCATGYTIQSNSCVLSFDTPIYRYLQRNADHYYDTVQSDVPITAYSATYTPGEAGIVNIEGEVFHTTSAAAGTNNLVNLYMCIVKWDSVNGFHYLMTLDPNCEGLAPTIFGITYRTAFNSLLRISSVSQSGLIPLYRYRNPSTGYYFSTTNSQEATSNGYILESPQLTPLGYVAP